MYQKYQTTSARISAKNYSCIILSVLTIKSIANETSVYYLRKFAKGYAHMHQCYQTLTSYVSLTDCCALAFHIPYTLIQATDRVILN